MHCRFKGLDTTSELSREIAKITAKKGRNKTEADEQRLRQLEAIKAIWEDDTGKPTIPPRVLRGVIEAAARKLKQGPLVREGLMLENETLFHYDKEKLGDTFEQLGISTQYTVPVVVGRSAIMRTRAMFKEWGCEFQILTDESLVDQEQLRSWLDIAGSRLGIGDWRPSKSGTYGTFQVVKIEQIESDAMTKYMQANFDEFVRMTDELWNE